MSQTVLQGLISLIQTNEYDAVTLTNKELIAVLERNLPAERQQMEDVWNDGYNTGHTNGLLYDMEDRKSTKQFSDYFTQTFNNGK